MTSTCALDLTYAVAVDLTAKITKSVSYFWQICEPNLRLDIQKNADSHLSKTVTLVDGDIKCIMKHGVESHRNIQLLVRSLAL